MQRQKSLGLYFGSFNPLHLGHWNIKTKAEKMFDVVKVVKLLNSNIEQYPVSKLIDIQFSMDPIILIEQFTRQYEKVIMIRGIRNEQDYIFESEYFDQLKLKNKIFNIAYILTDPEFKYMSSSWIKNLPKEEQQRYII